MRADLDIFYMRRIEDVTANPKQTKSDDDSVNSKDNYGKLVVAVFSEQGSCKRNKSDEKEKYGIEVCKIDINIFRIHGNKEMMRAPISEKESET